MDKFFPRALWARILVGAAYVGIAGAALYFGGSVLLRLLLPFAIAALTAVPVRALVCCLCKKKKGRIALSALFTAIIYAALAAIIYFLFYRVYLWLRGLITSSLAEPGALLADFENAIETLMTRFPKLAEHTSAGEIEEWLRNRLLALAGTLSARLPSLAAKFAMSLPEWLLFIVTMIMSTIFFGASESSLSERVLTKLPENFRGRGREHLVRLTCTAKRYFRALLVMMCLTFAVLAVGLLLLRIKNAVLLALLISLLDMLPVIGIGIILLPWAVWNLIIGNYFLGFGLMILFAVATIIREALEPRIVGGNIGMSAMATMFSMWCGFCLLGVAGLIVGPIAGVVDRGARDGRVKRE